MTAFESHKAKPDPDFGLLALPRVHPIPDTRLSQGQGLRDPGMLFEPIQSFSPLPGPSPARQSGLLKWWI